MPKHIDYTGQKIGRLTFVRDYKRGKKRIWVCACDCGNETEYRSDYISTMKSIGRAFECKECKDERRWPDLSDRQFGRLTVLRKTESQDGGHHTWYLCLCECGVEKAIKGTSLTCNKPTRSCGCYMRKIHSKWVNTTRYPPAHGHKKVINQKTIKEKIYTARGVLVSKCYNTDNPHYRIHGAKGVTVCDLWRNGVKDFYEWSLASGYEIGFGIYLKEGATEFNPSTAYWMDKGKFHSVNNSKWIEYKGETNSITGWAEVLGCLQSTLSQRIKKYGVEQAFDLDWTPARTQTYDTEHFEDDILRLYAQGRTYHEVADELGCSYSTIGRFLVKNNIPRRKATCRSSLIFGEKKPEIISLRSQGKSWTEIGNITSLKPHSIRYHYTNWMKEK